MHVGQCMCVGSNEVCSKDIVYYLKHSLLNICYLVYFLCYLSCRENIFKVLFFFNMMEEQCPLWRLHDTCVDVSLVSKSAVKCNIVWF